MRDLQLVRLNPRAEAILYERRRFPWTTHDYLAACVEAVAEGHADWLVPVARFDPVEPPEELEESPE
jgi:hypothetical protein